MLVPQRAWGCNCRSRPRYGAARTQPCLPKCDVYGNCNSPGVPVQDPLLDFPSEGRVMFVEAAHAPAIAPLMEPPIHAIDTTSRVISFVLGFALASLIAWLGSIPGDEVAATGSSEPVAAVGTPVVTAAIQEKKSATRSEPQAPATPVAAASFEGTAPAGSSTTRPVGATSAAEGAAAAATSRPVTSARPVAASNPPAAASNPAAASKTAEPATTPSRRPPASGYRGALALSSSPEGAQVVLNGKVVGQTPVVLNDLPVGSRAIVVRRDGYSPWSASVRVVANQRTTVRATLTPTPQSGG